MDPVCQKAAAADVTGGPLSLRAKLVRKLIVPAVTAFIACKRTAYRPKRPWAGKLGHLDHITIPCGDAQIAEEFYVGLLGAQVVNRIDRRLLRRIGWADADIDQNAAEHLSITFSGGATAGPVRVSRGITEAFRFHAPTHRPNREPACIS